MEDVMDHAPGTPLWIDLATPAGTTAASRFYCGLFGWQVVTSRRPLDDAGNYWSFQQDGKSVAGVGPPVHASRSGLPQRPRWTLYVSVADVDVTTRRVAESGGAILVRPRSINGAGRMAIYADPDGAEIAVWQSREISGFDLADEPNSYALGELSCHDIETVAHFYGAVFGWERKAEKWFLPGVDGGVAGLVHVADHVTPRWLIYFAVVDTDATSANAIELGGTVSVAPVDVSGMGRIAALEDPQGASFAIVQR